MIENVEGFETHFVREPLVNFRLFNQREVHVVEARSDNGVTPLIAKVQSTGRGGN